MSLNYQMARSLAKVSANQAVVATVQQYESVRAMLSLANLELARTQSPPDHAGEPSTDSKANASRPVNLDKTPSERDPIHPEH